jgi:CubicO group peptidase (beta-lactamase class C family)
MDKFFSTLFFKPNGKYAISTNAKLFNKRRYKQGEKFYYSSADTEFLARIVVSATKKSMTQLTQEWLWNPIGAEDNAYWLVSKSDNVEHGAGGFYATLRDYAKFAMMLANDGVVDSEQIISKKYLLDATDSDLQPNGFKKGQAQWIFGYGYQFWIHPMKDRTFSMQGIYGQNIFIQPSSKTIMIQTSVYEKEAADPSWEMQTDLFKEAIKLLGGNPY